MRRTSNHPAPGTLAALVTPIALLWIGCGFSTDVSFGDRRGGGALDPLGTGSGGSSQTSSSGAGAPPATCSDGVQSGSETDVDCGAECPARCAVSKACGTAADCTEGVCTNGRCLPATGTDGVQNGDESGVDCGGQLTGAARCALGQACAKSTDCASRGCKNALCIEAPSCVAEHGGSTCGAGEVGSGEEQHESCCTSLEVPGFADPLHPGQRVLLDKYEITAGRMRAFVDAMAGQFGGQPDIHSFLDQNQLTVWQPEWTKWMPSGTDALVVPTPNGGRHSTGSGCGASCNVGTSYQFGAALYQYTHGHNCYQGGESSYGFPTYWYPDDVMQGPNGGNPRAYSREILDAKSLNCAMSVMLQAFCFWDGGQLATVEVMQTVGQNLASRGITSGDGTQVGPYYYPANGGSGSDDAARVAAPGRFTADATTYQGAGPWMDLRGNLSEIMLDGGAFTVLSKFGGLGQGSAHGGGNDAEWLSHPEYKSGLSGGRCMRFKN